MKRSRVDQIAWTFGGLPPLDASSCSAVPFMLFCLDMSGAWIAHITALERHVPVGDRRI